MTAASLWLTILSNLSIFKISFSMWHPSSELKGMSDISKWRIWTNLEETQLVPESAATSCTTQMNCRMCESSQPWITGLVILHKDEDVSSRFVSNQLVRDGLSRISHRQGTLGNSVTPDEKSKGGGKHFRFHREINQRGVPVAQDVVQVAH